MQMTCRFLDIFSKAIVSFEDTFSIRKSVSESFIIGVTEIMIGILVNHDASGTKLVSK
jgi:hypothetical protein